MITHITRQAAPKVIKNIGKWRLVDYQEDPKSKTRTLKVLANFRGESEYLITRHPDGTLTPDGQPNSSDRPILLYQGQLSKLLPRHVSALLNIEATKRLSHAGWQEYSQNPWDRIPEVRRAVEDILNQIILPSNLPPTKGTALSAQPTMKTITQSVNRIIRARFLDGETLKLAKSIHHTENPEKPLTFREYNETVLNGALIAPLQEQNPSIMRLYLVNVLDNTPVITSAGHPGEITRRIKEHTRFSPPQWKQLHRITRKCPELTRHHDPAELALIADAVHAANRPDAAADKLRLIATNTDDLQLFQTAAWEHGDPWAAWTQILNQLMRTDVPTPQHATMARIADTFRAHVLNQMPWTPADWNTLLFRAEEWHQQQLHRTSWNIPNSQLQTEWHSALDETTIADTVYRPVTTAKQLARLGVIMGNCIATFWNRCQRGVSRIFTAHDPETGQLLAAVEITLQAAGWRTGQIEGPHRNPYPSGIRQHAEILCQLYQRADTIPQKGPGK